MTDDIRSTSVFKPGDILEVTHTRTEKVGPTVIRVLGVDPLGIIGNVPIALHLPPETYDGHGDYLDLDATHATVFPWSQVVSVHRVYTGLTYEKLWTNAEARWAAQS